MPGKHREKICFIYMRTTNFDRLLVTAFTLATPNFSCLAFFFCRPAASICFLLSFFVFFSLLLSLVSLNLRISATLRSSSFTFEFTFMFGMPRWAFFGSSSAAPPISLRVRFFHFSYISPCGVADFFEMKPFSERMRFTPLPRTSAISARVCFTNLFFLASQRIMRLLLFKSTASSGEISSKACSIFIAFMDSAPRRPALGCMESSAKDACASSSP
mmetsp:Transcript_19407/g.42050  ORF Transcript_19407/g.42050 Transcript_19407/m.42050 type:complete len:216 (+) Transcript_19407:47-694(+)